MQDFWDEDAGLRRSGLSADALCRAMIAFAERLKQKHNPLMVKYAMTVYINHAQDDVKALKTLVKSVKRHSWLNIHPLVPDGAVPEDIDPFTMTHSNSDAVSTEVRPLFNWI